MTRGLLIVFPYARMDTHPTMRNLLTAFAREWDFVHVVSAGGDAHLKNGDPVDACLVPNLPHSTLNPLVGRGSFIEQPRARFRATLAPRRLAADRARYAAIIGVDPEGLIQAHRLNRNARLPLVYLSFEIMFKDEIAGSPLEALKRRELEASREVRLALVQDDERAACLVDHNGLPRDSMVLVPNGPAPEPAGTSAYLREKLGIPASSRVVLYAGNLKTWASRDFFDEMLAFWPRDYVLVLHHWVSADSFLNAYLRRLRETGRVFVSEDPLPPDRLTSLYASADFGLAPFKPTPDYWDTGKNILHMGLSSGKVGYYSLCGLPMLASGIPVFRREFSEYRCGEVYSSIGQTGDLLQRMDIEYQTYRAESLRFYRERMDPTQGIRAFCERLRAVAS
ncbi:MAG: hypothetical protein IT364_15495 [Candidatus Hydrogenedentes bacterium]|nr:hypothetical protein [Candidatus Hydrogenedentota bacterium]